MSPRQPSRLLSPWDLAALAGLVALALFYRWILPHLPDPVPTHFDALGRANGWTPKGGLALVVFLPPVVLWTILFLVGAVAGLLPGGAGGGAVQPLRGMLGLGLCGVMGGCLLVPSQGQTALFGGLLFFFFCMALGIVFLVRNTWAAVGLAPRSEHYRCGMFYANPEDPRLWVPKRTGYGWTLNFARPAAYGVMLALAAGAVALGIGLRNLAH
jgi:uncharacterized membrane protein